MAAKREQWRIVAYLSWPERAGQRAGVELKYDLRDRSADREKMGIPAKGQGGAWGVTLSKEELQALKELLNDLEL